MKIEVELISKKIIKPSSPTPHHLRRYQLSFLDQLCPPVYYKLAFFYPHRDDPRSKNLEKFEPLEQSLSEVLNLYYPLAGRLKDNLYVDCDDDGIPCLQAQAKCKLRHVLEDPFAPELIVLFPPELDGAHELLLGVQFNVFECGGIGIGVCISHKIGDVLSFFTFVKSWAATARGEPNLVRPEFVSSTLFPARDLSGYNPSSTFTEEQIALKRLFFSNSSIQALTAENHHKGTNLDSMKPCPSPLQVLSVFIWNRIMAATKVELGKYDFYELLHLLDLRKRVDPPLPEYSFGNLQWVATTNIPSMQAEEHNFDLVYRVEESINKIDNEYVKALQESKKIVLTIVEEQAKSVQKGGAMRLIFSSLCECPIYEADFGWGKPTWAGLLPCMKFSNQIVFMDAASEEGIEAWMLLKEEDMAKLQEDKELLAFVAPTPC